METTTHPLTLTVEQAAKVLGISRSTAYELVHTGDIPSLRLGRRIVVPAAKLAESLGVEPAGLHLLTTDRRDRHVGRLSAYVIQRSEESEREPQSPPLF